MGGVIEVGEQGREYISLDPGVGPAYVTPNSAINGAANSAPAGGDFKLTLDLKVNGQTVQSALLNFGRAQGYRTLEQLLPIGTVR